MTINDFDPFSWNKDLGKLTSSAVGFEPLLEKFQSMVADNSKAVGWPPYNIKKIDDNKYMIEVAVAGFIESEIEVTIIGDKLIIKGQTKDRPDAGEYLFRGVAARPFTRTFNLADSIEIQTAEMYNGMLKIWLEQIIDADKYKVRKVDINPEPAKKEFLTETE